MWGGLGLNFQTNSIITAVMSKQTSQPVCLYLYLYLSVWRTCLTTCLSVSLHVWPTCMSDPAFWPNCPSVSVLVRLGLPVYLFWTCLCLYLSDLPIFLCICLTYLSDLPVYHCIRLPLTFGTYLSVSVPVWLCNSLTLYLSANIPVWPTFLSLHMSASVTVCLTNLSVRLFVHQPVFHLKNKSIRSVESVCFDCLCDSFNCQLQINLSNFCSSGYRVCVWLGNYQVTQGFVVGC